LAPIVTGCAIAGDSGIVVSIKYADRHPAHRQYLAVAKDILFRASMGLASSVIGVAKRLSFTEQDRSLTV
jgi:hypothetical protein